MSYFEDFRWTLSKNFIQRLLCRIMTENNGHLSPKWTDYDGHFSESPLTDVIYPSDNVRHFRRLIWSPPKLFQSPDWAGRFSNQGVLINFTSWKNNAGRSTHWQIIPPPKEGGEREGEWHKENSESFTKCQHQVEWAIMYSTSQLPSPHPPSGGTTKRSQQLAPCLCVSVCLCVTDNYLASATGQASSVGLWCAYVSSQMCICSISPISTASWLPCIRMPTYCNIWHQYTCTVLYTYACIILVVSSSLGCKKDRLVSDCQQQFFGLSNLEGRYPTIGWLGRDPFVLPIYEVASLCTARLQSHASLYTGGKISCLEIWIYYLSLSATLFNTCWTGGDWQTEFRKSYLINCM